MRIRDEEHAIELLQSDHSGRRFMAVRYLGFRRRWQLLIPLLDDPIDYIREDVVLYIAARGDILLVLPYVSDKHSCIRYILAAWICLRGDYRLCYPLLYDKKESVSKRAWEYIKKAQEQEKLNTYEPSIPEFRID